MAVPISVAKLGWGTTQLTLVEWKAKEGDWVEQGSPILVIESEKITADIEAEASGYLHILVEEGGQAPPGSAVGSIAETKDELKSLPQGTAHQKSKEAAPPTRKIERIRISPVARRLAEEHGVDIASITGTGPDGRIVREDVDQAIKAQTGPATSIHEYRRLQSVIPLKDMRKVIAEHMHHSLAISAQLTIMGEIDMAEMVKVHQKLVDQTEAAEGRITYTDIFVFALAQLLKDHPIINSSLIDNEIKLWESINIGVAVALEDGLMVPVVKDADKKSLEEISQTVKTLVQKARQGNLVPEDVKGGTFTLTNLGALGGGYRFETAIINQPESAILGTGGITDRVVARDGQIVIRPIMTYYFTYDHRVINGHEAAEFMADFTRLIEDPSLLSM